MSEGNPESGQQIVLDCEADVIERIERTAASRGVTVEQHLKDSVALGVWAAEAETDGAELYAVDGRRLTALDWPGTETF